MVIDFRPQKNCGKDVVSPSKRPFLHGLVHGGVAQTGVYGPRAPPGMHSIVTWVCLGSQTPSLKRHEFFSQFSILVVTLFCAYHLYIPWSIYFIHGNFVIHQNVHAKKNHPTFPNLSNSPTSSLPTFLSPKKTKNLLHLLCAHSTSHRTKAIPSLATALAAPKANGGAIQGTVGRPTARQPIRGHREHRRVQPATQQVVRGNARLAGRWVGPLLDIAER